MAEMWLTLFECKDCKRLFNSLELFTKHDCCKTGSGGFIPADLFGEQEALDLPVVQQFNSMDSSQSSSGPRSSKGPSLQDTSRATTVPESLGAPSVSSGCEESQPEVIYWTRPSTLCLIDQYQQKMKTNGKQRKKSIGTDSQVSLRRGF